MTDAHELAFATNNENLSSPLPIFRLEMPSPSHEHHSLLTPNLLKILKPQGVTLAKDVRHPN
jgi:hypothetical protein